jgi:oligopeptide/dipeptide ABC transporter ATP-binding protein
MSEKSVHKPDPILKVTDLKVSIRLDEGVLKAVDGISFEVHRHRTLGIIGESGCGKSVTAQALLRIVPPPGRIDGGSILLFRDGRPPVDLAALKATGKEIRAIRGKEIAMIFQEPMTSLSPVHTIGDQIAEAIRLHRTRNRREAKSLTAAMLERVGISNVAARMREYPHQLSGGMRQRAMIAMALSCNPPLLIADEPTTALDVTVQAQILELMKELQRNSGMAIVFISHDLGTIAEMADEVAVMYLGRIIEFASVRDLFHHPLHPYTLGLLRSTPVVGGEVRRRLDTIQGTVPIPINLPSICGFMPRCPKAVAGLCDRGIPPLTEVTPGHWVRCVMCAGRASQGPSHDVTEAQP